MGIVSRFGRKDLTEEEVIGAGEGGPPAGL